MIVSILVAFCCLLLILPSSLGGSGTSIELNEKEIQRAIALLESNGITGLCHPTSADFESFFRQCNNFHDDNIISIKESVHHGLRKISSISNSDASSSAKRDLLESEGFEFKGDEDRWFYIWNGIYALVCVSMAALAAGLTMGLMSLDPLMLLIKQRAGSTELEKKQAAALLPLVKQHHRLLVSLLLLNSMSNEALPIFLGKIVPEYVAVILSVTLVLFFGEIIPSAVFTGPDQIKIAFMWSSVVKVVMFILSPLAIPIAWLLDVVLHDDGAESNMFNRGELSALVRIQYEERLAEKERRKREKLKMRTPNISINSFLSSDRSGSAGSAMSNGSDLLDNPMDSTELRNRIERKKSIKKLIKMESRKEMARLHESFRGDLQESFRVRRGLEGSIHGDEVLMVEGALQMTKKVALDEMTPYRKVFAVPSSMILNEKNMVKIHSCGYSRIPVYDDNSKGRKYIRGILITRQLIVVNSTENRLISTMPLHIPHCVSHRTRMVDLINLFQTGGKVGKVGHMALVCLNPKIGNEALHSGKSLPESAGLMGIITLEDALETLIQEEIYDEMDKSLKAQRKIVSWVSLHWRRYVERKKCGSENGEEENTETTPLLV